MSYIITLEVPDNSFIVPWYDIFEHGCCAGCPNNFYNAEKNQTICGIMGAALPIGYDHDQNPWPLRPIKFIKHTDNVIPTKKDGLKWLHPDAEDK